MVCPNPPHTLHTHLELNFINAVEQEGGTLLELAGTTHSNTIHTHVCVYVEAFNYSIKINIKVYE